MFLNFVKTPNKVEAEVTCTFPSPLLLREPHELGILSLDITQTFHNGPFGGGLRVRSVEQPAGRSVYFPEQVYASIQDVVKVLNALITGLDAKEHVKWSARDAGIRVVVRAGFAVDLNYPLESFLQLESGRLNNLDGDKDLTVTCYPDILKNFRRVFLECEQTERLHYYKNSLLPVLCTFPIHQKDPEIDMLSRDFNDPIYYKLLNSSYLERLTVKFLDELRRPLKVDKGGYCYVLGHLRPVKYNGQSCQRTFS